MSDVNAETQNCEYSGFVCNIIYIFKRLCCILRPCRESLLALFVLPVTQEGADLKVALPVGSLVGLFRACSPPTPCC